MSLKVFKAVLQKPQLTTGDVLMAAPTLGRRFEHRPSEVLSNQHFNAVIGLPLSLV